MNCICVRDRYPCCCNKIVTIKKSKIPYYDYVSFKDIILVYKSGDLKRLETIIEKYRDVVLNTCLIYKIFLHSIIKNRSKIVDFLITKYRIYLLFYFDEKDLRYSLTWGMKKFVEKHKMYCLSEYMKIENYSNNTWPEPSISIWHGIYRFHYESTPLEICDLLVTLINMFDINVNLDFIFLNYDPDLSSGWRRIYMTELFEKNKYTDKITINIHNYQSIKIIRELYRCNQLELAKKMLRKIVVHPAVHIIMLNRECLARSKNWIDIMVEIYGNHIFYFLFDCFIVNIENIEEECHYEYCHDNIEKHLKEKLKAVKINNIFIVPFGILKFKKRQYYDEYMKILYNKKSAKFNCIWWESNPRLVRPNEKQKLAVN